MGYTVLKLLNILSLFTTVMKFTMGKLAAIIGVLPAALLAIAIGRIL